MRNTVLIVDNDAGARINKQALLGGRGLHVIAATSATEACDIVCREGAAVVIISVSNGSGLKCAARLRGQCDTFIQPTPRFVVLADHEGREVTDLHVDALMLQPVVPDHLIATIEKLVAASAPQAAGMASGF